jgi:hypothetical protein
MIVKRMTPVDDDEEKPLMKNPKKTLETVLAETRSLIPPGGIVLQQLKRELSRDAIEVMIKSSGSVEKFISANPQLFRAEEIEIENRDGKVKMSRMIYTAR